jgi:hypothetical protein
VGSNGRRARNPLVSFWGKRPIGKLTHVGRIILKLIQINQEEYMAQCKRRDTGAIDGIVKCIVFTKI